MCQSRGTAGQTRPIKRSIAAPAFDLRVSMDCGQIFGWHQDRGTYTGIIGETAVVLRQSGGRVYYVADRAIPGGSVASYLGLDADLERIRREIARDAFMRRVVGSVKGLRILRQDIWPCLCSYILSANNRVERIDRLVKDIASTFGKPHRVNGRTVYSLPEPEELGRCAESGVRSCGAGFRAPYLLEAVRDMDESEGREALKRLPGVGDKIADCIMLFAFSKYGVFPVDVWIKRVMERVYFHSCDVRPAEIRQFGQAYFGAYAGYAQEYIYCYARTFGLDW
jgi:N-glycosylase/DNA lyase